MTAFIKFCGGCNEKYSRSSAVKLLKSVFANQLEFINHDPSKPCDVGVIISGCETECIKTKDLAPAGLYVNINSMESLDDAVKAIKDYIKL
jgi:hypothetical protein